MFDQTMIYVYAFRAIHKNNKASEYILRNIEYDLVKIHYV